MTQLGLSFASQRRRVVVGFSGGVTSAWCAGWALRTFERDEVILLFHDTKEEHPDTYRFIKEASTALGKEVIERSDGRSVTQLFHDEGMLGNNQNTMCSRILKAEPGQRFIGELQAQGFHVIKVIGYSAHERKRIDRMVGHCASHNVEVRFPIIEEGISKQDCANWVQCDLGVKPSAMYEHFEHANCRGCVKGAREYWLKVYEVDRQTFDQRAALEDEYGHPINRGGNPIFLRDLIKIGLKRPSQSKERIEIGACECGD